MEGLLLRTNTAGMQSRPPLTPEMPAQAERPHETGADLHGMKVVVQIPSRDDGIKEAIIDTSRIVILDEIPARWPEAVAALGDRLPLYNDKPELLTKARERELALGLQAAIYKERELNESRQWVHPDDDEATRQAGLKKEQEQLAVEVDLVDTYWGSDIREAIQEAEQQKAKEALVVSYNKAVVDTSDAPGANAHHSTIVEVKQDEPADGLKISPPSDSHNPKDAVDAPVSVLGLAPLFFEGTRSPRKLAYLALSRAAQRNERKRPDREQRLIKLYNEENRKDAETIVLDALAGVKSRPFTHGRKRQQKAEALALNARNNPQALKVAVDASRIIAVIKGAATRDTAPGSSPEGTERRGKRTGALVGGLAALSVVVTLAGVSVTSGDEGGNQQNIAVSSGLSPQESPVTVSRPVVIVEQQTTPTTVIPAPEAAPVVATPPTPATPDQAQRAKKAAPKKTTTTTAVVPPTTASTAGPISPNTGKPCLKNERIVKAGEVPTKADPTPRFTGQCIPKVGP